METVNQILAVLLPHWPFVAAVVVFMLVGQVMNHRIFTQAAMREKPLWFWWWGRKTLPLHPVITGAVVAALWKLPEPGVDSLAERMGYFCLAGAVSVFAYEVLKGLAKRKGIDLELPGNGAEAKPDVKPGA